MKSQRPTKGKDRSDRNAGASSNGTYVPADWEARVCDLEFRVTQLVTDNQTLREMNHQLEASLHAATRLQNFGSFGTMALDRRGVIVDANDYSAVLLGRSKKSLSHVPLSSLFKEKEAAQLISLLKECRSVQAPLSGFFHFPSDKVVELTCSPIIPTPDGGIVFHVTLQDVTRRKRAEADLRLSEEMLRALVEASPHPIQYKDGTGRWLLANAAALDLFGLHGVDYKFKTDEELATLFPFCRLALEMRQGADRAALQMGKLVRGNELVFNLDGSTRVLDVLRVPLKADGQAKGIVVLGYDITERQRGEEKLRQAYEEMEQRVRDRTAELSATLERINDLYHNTPCGYHSLDRNGIYVEVNNTELQLLGYERSELIGRKTSFELQTPKSRVIGRQVFEQLMRCGSVHDVELELVRKDGSILPVLLTASAVRDDRGNFLRSRSAIIDITDRKRAEHALRESESRLQAILDNSPAIIFLKDVQGRYLHINREFSKVFHITLEDAVGRTDAEIFGRKSPKLFSLYDSKVLENDAPVQFDEATLREDGQHTSIVTKFPLYNHEGKIHAIGGIVTDITERRRLEEEVLRVSEREQRRIAQDLHDGVGQQLAGLWCLSDILHQDLRAKCAAETKTARQISNLLKTTLDQTRNLARGLHPVSAEANGLMSALEDLASHITNVFKVPCHLQCRHKVLLEDNNAANHLFRIAQEAVTNAMKHGKARRIEIGLSSTPRSITLSVADDGVGFQKKREPKKGMGLRIMNYRANIIGGTLSVRHQVRGGTEVICNLPWPGTTRQLDETISQHLQGKETKKGVHRRRSSGLPRRSRQSH